MLGIPLFYLQELKGIMMQFRDNFADQSLYWAWNTDEVYGNKEVIETATGKLLIRVTGAATNAKWRDTDNFAPKVVIGGGAFPLEVIVKMESVVMGENTQAGLYISGNPGGMGSNMCIVRVYYDDAWNGLKVFYNETVQRWQGEISDDPIFFRIRVGNWTFDRKKVIFGYSLNGVQWIDVYEEASTPWADQWGMGVGMFVSNDSKNLGDRNPVSAQFDYFKMRTRSINIG